MSKVDTYNLATYWWTLTVRGIFAVVFGIAAVFWPHITLVVLVYIFSTWILVDGVVRLVAGLTRIGEHQLGALTAVIGILEVGLGVYLLRHPLVTFTTLVLLIGFMLIIDGVVSGVAALASNEDSGTKTLTIIVAILALIAGILMLFQPVASGVAFVWILGLYALIAGPMLIVLSFEVKKLLNK
jgi:uncharacterized membrane protein HdeD (DUF308 family)